MSDKPAVTLFGKSYPIVGPSEFNLGELNDCEVFFGAEFADEAVNSRKLAAILFVSVRRVDPKVKPEDVRSLTAEDLEAIHVELLRWQSEDEVGDASPPDESALDAQPSSERSSNGSTEPPSELAPIATGSQPSDTGSTFDRLTSVS